MSYQVLCLQLLLLMSMANINILNSVGGIISTYSFLSKDAPFYTRGFRIGISFCCLSALAATLYLLALMQRNRSRDKLAAANGSQSDDATYEDNENMGDLNPNFRYQY